jgi:hypothetical protein
LGPCRFQRHGPSFKKVFAPPFSKSGHFLLKHRLRSAFRKAGPAERGAERYLAGRGDRTSAAGGRNGSAASREFVEALLMHDQKIVGVLAIDAVMPKDISIEAELDAA